jgi:1-acyl-sn-glycerol-3-phosphate acyltransferase
MPAAKSFYPPKLSLPLVAVMQKLAPMLALRHQQMELVVTPRSLTPLETVKRKPCILLCNHPTFSDPTVMFLLSTYVGLPFHYLSALEQFKGRQGWLYQHIGAYSVQRGIPDRDSIEQTIALMSRPDCKLMIFPEGGCSFQNDTIMPFRAGAIRMGLQAIAKRVKNGEPLPDLYVVPMSLKYRYTGNMLPAIDQTLRRLEQALKPERQGDFYDFYNRLRLVAERVILRCEKDYQITPSAHSNWNERIDNIKQLVLDHCEQQLSLSSSVGDPHRERVYRIRYAMANRSVTILPDGRDGWDIMAKATMRVLNFDAIYDGYVSSKPTAERFLDTLVRLEREVFDIDQPPAKGHRHAMVRVGEPINLAHYYEGYLSDRIRTIEALNEQIQVTMQTNLDLLSEGCIL